QLGADSRRLVHIVLPRCGVTASASLGSPLLSVQSGASRNVCDAGRMAPFSAPLGTTVGTSGAARSSVPVAFKTSASAPGTSTGMAGKLFTEADRSYKPTWV